MGRVRNDSVLPGRALTAIITVRTVPNQLAAGHTRNNRLLRRVRSHLNRIGSRV